MEPLWFVNSLISVFPFSVLIGSNDAQGILLMFAMRRKLNVCLIVCYQKSGVELCIVFILCRILSLFISGQVSISGNGLTATAHFIDPMFDLCSGQFRGRSDSLAICDCGNCIVVFYKMC